MFRSKKDTYVDPEIERLTLKLSETQDVNSKEYKDLLESLTELHAIRKDEKPDTVSSDAIFQGAISLVGIALIINHEHLHPITTRAMSFIKLK